ncbi:DUF3618 domain-containing protein [Microlunatus flavus]|uniref:DUF3618 domain-containing protein n=1 Tax=Microlunatus flavus TaxID=1036181 RepID=A0A1H9CPG7_9ACTN|nr:DUF3618 domain-containing protein [Microlunatus flavus]SEQ03112.1 Protein of unknown function [Microlunatus flavus]
MSTQANEPSLTGRTKSQIEADLGATRDRLAASVSGLIDEVHPTRIKQRTVGRLRAELQARLDDVRAYFFNARGDVRTDHVLSAGGVAAGTLTLILGVRALLRRRR